MLSRDSFQDLDTFRASADQVQFTLVAPGSRALPKPPRFFFGCFPEPLSSLFFSRLVVKPQGVWSVRDVTLRGSFVMSVDSKLVYSSALRILPQIIEDELEKIPIVDGLCPRRRLTGTHVLLVGPGHRIYGHWLVDILPKLYLLHAAGLALNRLKFLLPANTPAFGRAWLDLLGIGGDQIVQHAPRAEELEIEDLLIPTGFRHGNRFAPSFRDAIGFLRNLIETRTGPLNAGPGTARVFLARTDSSNRACVNRKHIEEMAQQAGFSLIRPETLPLVEQLRLFAGAHEIVGEYGSALHGTMFSNAGTVVCGLRSTSTVHAAFVQSGIGDVLSQPTGYVFGDPGEGGMNESFRIPENLFADCLRLVFAGAEVT